MEGVAQYLREDSDFFLPEAAFSELIKEKEVHSEYLYK